MEGMDALFAQSTLIGSCANSVPGQFLVKKWPVAAVSGWALTSGCFTTAAYDNLF